MKKIILIFLIFSLLGCGDSQEIANEKEIINDIAQANYSTVSGRFSFVFVMDSLRILQSFPPDSLFLPLEIPKNLPKENQALRLGMYYTDYLAYLKNGDSVKKKAIQKQIETLSTNLDFTDFMLIIRTLDNKELINEPRYGEFGMSKLHQSFYELESKIPYKYINDYPQFYVLFMTGYYLEQEHLLLATNQTFRELRYQFQNFITFEQSGFVGLGNITQNHHYYHFHKKFIVPSVEVHRKAIHFPPIGQVCRYEDENGNYINPLPIEISVQFLPLQNTFFPKNSLNLRDQLLQYFTTPTSPVKIGFYQLLQKTEDLLENKPTE